MRLKPVARFDQPIYVSGPAGAHGLVFVVERPGRIRMLENDRKLKGSFLDISDLVSCCDGERGLFSVAFSPDYGRSGLFYVYFTNDRGDIEVDRFRRSPHRATRADRGSRRKLLEINHRRFDNHNGGQLQFGPDGDLYIGTGDGGGAGDPFENGQDKGALLGKLLRIDPAESAKRGYRIPNTNPYAHRKGADAIYSIGLRNPWRFSFDRGHLVIADVGQDSWEEVDYVGVGAARGANFGWDAFEGTHPFEGGSLHHDVKPIFEYPHDGGRCSITGGYVVRDKSLGGLYGRYVYGDLCTGEIRSFVPHASGASGDAAVGVANEPGITSFGVDARKRVYVTVGDGSVLRFEPA